MRRRHKKYRRHSRRALLNALSILSQAAAIIGTMVAIIDTLHRW
jgi:hypothetical protein